MESSSGTFIPARLPVPRNLIAHGIVMLILALLVYVAHWVLGLCAVIQFLWMLVMRERNIAVAEFGEGIAHWLAMTARFLSGASDARPFPWSSWARS